MAMRWLRSIRLAVSWDAATAADEVCSKASRCVAEQCASTASMPVLAWVWTMCSANPRSVRRFILGGREALRFVSVLNALEEYLFAAGVINQSPESLPTALHFF